MMKSFSFIKDQIKLLFLIHENILGVVSNIEHYNQYLCLSFETFVKTLMIVQQCMRFYSMNRYNFAIGF